MTGRRVGSALVLTALIVGAGCGDDIEPGTVSALRAADGIVVWERPTQPSPVEVLTDGHWVVTVGFRGCDNSGQVSVLDASTGDEQWSMATVGGFGQRQVALAGDVVVNASDEVVTALRVDDGTELWSRKDLAGNLLVNGVAGTTVIGIHDHDRTPASSRLLAVDATTGATRWETPLDGLGQIVDVVVVGELVIARLSGTGRADAGRTSVVAVALGDGSSRWQREVGVSEIAEPLMVAGTHAVVGFRTNAFVTTDGSGNLVDEVAPSASIVVLDTATGDERWRVDREFDLTDEVARDVQPMATDESLVIARDGEQLVALDASTGALQWSAPGYRGGAWIVGMLVLSVPNKWIDGSGATLDAIDRTSGSRRWSRSADGATARAAGAGEMIFTVDYGRQPSCD